MAAKVRSSELAEKGFDLEMLLSIMLFLLVAYTSFSYVFPALKSHFASSQIDVFGVTEVQNGSTK